MEQKGKEEDQEKKKNLQRKEYIKTNMSKKIQNK